MIGQQINKKATSMELRLRRLWCRKNVNEYAVSLHESDNIPTVFILIRTFW